MSQPPSQQDCPDISFREEIDNILRHPYFPLLIKKVFDACGLNAFEHPSLFRDVSALENEASRWQHFAEIHGPLAAEKHWNSMSLFMLTVIAALSRISAVGCGSEKSLQNTVATVKKAIHTPCNHPCFVGHTHNRRQDVLHRLEPTLPTQESQRPENIRQPDDHAQSSHGIQSVSGIKKPVQTSRTLLSEKAKATLERWFQEHLADPYPTPEEKEKLAIVCAVSLSSVNNWFGNKRMRVKRKMLKVKSQEGEQISNKVLAPKSKWNEVVLSKMTSQAGREVLACATGRAAPFGNDVGIVNEGHPLQALERVGQSGPGRPESAEQ